MITDAVATVTGAVVPTLIGARSFAARLTCESELTDASPGFTTTTGTVAKILAHCLLGAIMPSPARITIAEPTLTRTALVAELPVGAMRQQVYARDPRRRVGFGDQWERPLWHPVWRDSAYIHRNILVRPTEN